MRVLIIDDESAVAEAHAAYLARVPGFELAGTARSAAAAISALSRGDIDLALLDMTLPDGHGLDVARRARALALPTDFIAITAARELETVRQAVSLGISHYLIKPFGFAAFRDKLEAYAEYRRRILAAPLAASQAEIDRVLGDLRAPGAPALPKGLASPTLEGVVAVLRTSVEPLSAAEVAEQLELSRVTARRYLEHLADARIATRHPRYGSPGRPEVAYRLVGAPGVRR